MINKRNIVMYIKQKSSITAFSFMLIFIVCFVISFLPSLEFKKGITDEFKKYDITYMNTNNYNVTYAVSDNVLFFSQNKKHISSLNDFAGIKDYSNEYGDPTNNIYNFIKLCELDYKIVDVKGIMDNQNGDQGETFILTENSNLYLISQYSNKVELLAKDVKDFNVFATSSTEELYLILDNQNTLSLCFFDNKQLKKHNIYNGDISDFYYYGKNNILFLEDNELKTLKINVIDNNELTYNKIITYGFNVLQCNEDVIAHAVSLNVRMDKLINTKDKYFYLYNNKVATLKFNDTIISGSLNINFNKKVNDIYSLGPDTIIAKCDDGLYYLGVLKGFINSEETFTYLNIKDGMIYGNKNSVILLDENNKLHLYKEKEFVGMYKNIFTTIILRYASLFVIVMIIFYIILSFIEDNKRFNRYFKHHKANDEIINKETN